MNNIVNKSYSNNVILRLWARCYASQVSEIVLRLQRPTIASVCNTWNFDVEDGSLLFLRHQDPVIRLPYRTQRRSQSAVAATARGRRDVGGAAGARMRRRADVIMPMSGRWRITIDDLKFFDDTRPHTGRSRRAMLNSQAST